VVSVFESCLILTFRNTSGNYVARSQKQCFLSGRKLIFGYCLHVLKAESAVSLLSDRLPTAGVLRDAHIIVHCTRGVFTC